MEEIDLDKKNKTIKENLTQLSKELDFVDPISSPISDQLRSKLLDILYKIESNALYIGSDYLTFELKNGSMIPLAHFPVMIIASYLINKSSTLITGSPGTGKTSTIRYISRYISNSSISNMDNIVHCDTEICKEDWIGEKDPRDVISGKGQWKMNWANWIKMNGTELVDIIFDEINRAPRNLQNQILGLLADGKVQYGVSFNEALPEINVFMTMNRLDEKMGTVGIQKLEYALLDRITQSIDVPHSNRMAKDLIRYCRVDDRNLNYDEDNIVNAVFNINELHQAKILVSKIPVDEDAHLFATYLSQDANLCLRAPHFDKSLLSSDVQLTTNKNGLCEGCLMAEHQCHICRMFLGGSTRVYKDLISLGKAYAFLIKEESVSKEIILTIASDVLSHRIMINQDDKMLISIIEKANLRKFIYEKYIHYCYQRLTTRKEAELLYMKIRNGLGTKDDFNRLKQKATDDLYIRIDLIQSISIGDNIHGAMVDYKPIYTAIDSEYCENMKKAYECHQKIENTSDLREIEEKINMLKHIETNLPNTKLKRNMLRIISVFINNGINKIRRKIKQ